MTQKQLAEEASLYQPQVSTLERGKACPRLDTVVRIFACLGIDPREAMEALD
ncbi:MAG: helix-turn-helix domain-containing protein [Solirubrobacterales bacterium]